MYGIAVSFVDLGVLAELEAEVRCIVNGTTSDDLEWAEVASNRR